MRLPVLMYHHVGPVRRGTFAFLTVSPGSFGAHVRWLARQGYVGIRPSDWLAWCRGEATLPDKPVLITFDNAYADVAEYALPVLRGCGFGAAVFVVTGLVGKTNAWDESQCSGTHSLMTAQQIRQWAGQGIEFGAHRVCVETRFSWLEIKRDHDPLQSSGVSIFAESPVRESAELAFLI